MRWAPRAFVWVVAAIGVLLLVVQIVLLTAWPRSLMVSLVQQETGLRIAAAKVRVGLFGSTTLEGVSAALPFEDAPFVSVPTLRVSHTPLPLVIVGAGFSLRSAELDRPRVEIRRTEGGEWNVLEAVSLLTAGGAKDDQNGGGGVTDVPRVEIHEGVLVLEQGDRPARQIPLELRSRTGAPLVWEFTLELGSELTARGRVLTGKTWQHEVDLSLRDGRRLLGDTIPAEGSVEVEADWSGSTGEKGLTAQLRVRRGLVAGQVFNGAVSIQQDGPAWVFTPSDVELVLPATAGQPLILDEGTVRLDGALLRVAGVGLWTFDTTAQVDASWDRSVGTAQAGVRWAGVVPGAPISHAGSADLDLTMPGPGPLDARLSVAVNGSAPQGEWRARALLDASGRDWDQVVGRLSSPELTWRDAAGVVDLSGLAAGFEVMPSLYRLTYLTIPGTRKSTATAFYDTAASTWEMALDVEGWSVPRSAGMPLDVRLQASGDAERALLPVLRIAGGTEEIEVSGEYAAAGAPEVVATVWAKHTPAEEKPGPEVLLSEGSWTLNAQVEGSVEPLRLGMEGTALGQGIALGKERIAELTVPIRGQATEGGGRVETETLRLLDGELRLGAAYDRQSREGRLQVRLDGLPLAEVARATGVPVVIAGALGLDVEVLAPELDLSRAQGDGIVLVADPGSGLFTAEQGRGRLTFRRDLIRLSEFALRRGDAQAVANLELDPRRANRLKVDVESRDWPVSVPAADVEAAVNLSTDLVVDLEELGAEGRIETVVNIRRAATEVGTLSLDGSMDGRVLRAGDISFATAGGELRGSAAVPLDSWKQTVGHIRTENFDLAALGERLGLRNTTGTVRGIMIMRPSVSDTAPEDVLVDCGIRPSEGTAIETMSLGDISFTAYLGERRSVLQNFTVQMAGGTLDLWARLSDHDGNKFVFFKAEADNLEAQQLYNATKLRGQGPPTDGEAAPSDAKVRAEQPMRIPGQISGRLAAGLYINRPRRAFGEGLVTVRNSDFGELPLIASLYNFLDVTTRAAEPTGAGEVRLRLEGDALEIVRAYYFNRGTDVVASGTIKDVWSGSASPVEGLAAASIRPLKELGLPFAEDLDRIVGGIQGGGTLVELGGTVETVEVHVVPFSSVQRGVGRLLGTGGPEKQR